MYRVQSTSRHFVLAAAWVLLGLALGLHFPDIDSRLNGLIPSWVLLHRSILTHGMMASLLLFWLVRRRGGTATALRLFAIGFSLAVAVHLCFDFFPRGWTGFALIHVPIYGRTTAFFSQSWIVLGVVACLYVGFLLAKNTAELVLGIVNLMVSFAVSVFENGRIVLGALILLTVATVVTISILRRARKAGARRI